MSQPRGVELVFEAPPPCVTSQGHFLSLACHRNGSRVLDAILASCSKPTRAAIASELGERPQKGPEFPFVPMERALIKAELCPLRCSHTAPAAAQGSPRAPC